MIKHNITNPLEKVTLFGQELRELFDQGKDAWNAWVEKHPAADIDFDSANLRANLVENNIHIVSFIDLDFPCGNIKFSKITLRSRYGYDHRIDLDISGVDFRQSTVDFNSINMFQRTLSCVGTRFGPQNISFANSKLANIDFTATSFGKGNI